MTGEQKSMDYERSLTVARDMGYLYEPGCCWHNAVAALRRYPKRLAAAVNVEGWSVVVSIGCAQEHGWLELEDGTIIDPTYTAADDSQGKRQSYEYFPALRYTREELKGVPLRSLPRVWKTGGFGGIQNEAYYAAMIEAYKRVGIELPLQKGSEQ